MLAVEAAPGATAGTAASAAADGRLILDENAYCRAYYQFGWDRIDPVSLKRDGERLLGKRGMDRLESSVKKCLADRKIDWSGTDWRDHAVKRFIVISHHMADSPEMLRASQTPPAPAGWARPDFDDGDWPRFRKPFAVGAETGMYFSQWSVRSPGLRAAHLRYVFDIAKPDPNGSLTLRAEYVGGVRFFLNGHEVARGHLPAGDIPADAPAEAYSEEAYLRLFTELTGRDKDKAVRRLKGKTPPKWYGDASWQVKPGSRLYRLRNRALEPVRLPAKFLRAGRNVLAVEVHAAPLHVLASTGQSAGGYSRGWLHSALTTLSLRAKGHQVLSGLRRPRGMQVWAEDMHRRVFSAEYLPPGCGAGRIRLVGTRGGTYGAQVVVGTDAKISGLAVTCEDLKGSGPARIAADKALTVFGMRGYPPRNGFGPFGEGRIGGNNFFTLRGYRSLPQYNAYVRWGKPGGKDAWENLLVFDQISRAVPTEIPADTCQPLWVRLRVPDDVAPGTYRGAVRVRAAGAEPVSVPLELEVVDWSLPDPQHFQAVAAIEQSPYGIAKAYKTSLWSEKHLRLLEASVRELARIGNDWWFVPIIHHTEFGNRADSMVRWVRGADGGVEFDFAILDRYLDMIVKHCGTPRVVSFVVMHGAPGPVEVAVLDRKTGRTETLRLGPGDDAQIRRENLRALAEALHAHMRARSLGEAMHWGYAWDTEGDPKIKELLRGCVPDVYWTFGAHSRGAAGSGGRMARESLRYYRSTSNIYGPEPGLKSRQGWKNPDVCLLNPRVLSSCSSTEGHAPPFNFRLMVDRALVAGLNGLGRIGGDYWAGSYYDGCRASAYHQASFSVLTVLWPGADGAEPSARYEAMIEGYQEAEARIFIEQALDRKLLGPKLARRAQHVLDEHNRQTLFIPVHVTAHQLTEGAQDWRARSRRLYRMAAEVAAAVGLDVERTEFAAKDLTIPAGGQQALALTIRNWTGKSRAWKATASEPWIRPAKTAGSVTDRAQLAVTLDGSRLTEGATAAGTLTVTDATTGAPRVVRIEAAVTRAIDIAAESTIFNVTAGAKAERTFTVINKTRQNQEWRIEASAPWLKAEPATGTLRAGGVTAVRITASPPADPPKLHDVALTLIAFGGKARYAVPLHVFVIPPYRAPASLPNGTAVPLNTVHKKIVTSHRSMNWFRAKVNRSATFGRALSFWGPPKPIVLGLKKYDMALWVLPRHETVYKLNAAEGGGPYKAFSVEVGVNAIVSQRAAGHHSLRVCFEVHVDGRLAAHSGLMKSTDGPRLLVVKGLAGAKEMKLITRLHTMLYDDTSYRGEIAYSNWADPKLYK